MSKNSLLNTQAYNFLKNYINKDFTVTKFRSSEANQVFELKTDMGRYFLKIGKDLKREYERLIWLENKLPVPKIVGFMGSETENDLLLQTAVEGEDLATLSKIWDASKVIRKLAEAIKLFQSIDIADCPFGSWEEGKVLTHGDACLPNLIFQENSLFQGFIDLGDVSIGFKEVDLSAAIWSLEFNLKKDYGLQFLKVFGIKNPTQEMVDDLRKQYKS